MIRFASEDVGLADSSSLSVATAALSAVQHLGMPECGVVTNKKKPKVFFFV